MRELHWHATAAEWAFVIEGRNRTTVIDPQGNAETDDFGPTAMIRLSLIMMTPS
jgi:oxalate decarboxylase